MYDSGIIIGSSGAIGSGLVTYLTEKNLIKQLRTVSRQQETWSHACITHHVVSRYDDENALASIAAESQYDLVLVATGLLHGHDIKPEKALRDITVTAFNAVFHANSTTPALIMKHFLPRLIPQKRAIFGALSARVGSISDNNLGGWYAYRASKSALNMIVKTASIEVARRHKHAIIVGLHPGTVDSRLSEPFKKNVKPNSLFSGAYAAQKLVSVINTLTPEQSGRCFAWDNSEVMP